MKAIIAVALASILVSAPQAQAQALRRAVLIDGFKASEGGWVASVRKDQAAIGAMLRSKGYAVAEFSAPVLSFPAIRDALNGAEIVVYWGHGVILSPGGCYNPESANVGGFSIDGRHISPAGLRREVRLAPTAIVLLPNSCYAAGNASMDAGRVRREVLEARMVNYARPFTEIGARCVGSCLDAKAFLVGVLAGKSFEKAYEDGAWAGKTVARSLDAYEFRYRESSVPGGIRTNSAVFWKARP